jgi:phosphotriesterase-related protein
VTAIETVSGPIEAADLGTVLVHEHARVRDEAVAAQWPDRYEPAAELSAALEAVGAAADRGVRTICDPSPMFAGRDVRFMRRVSDDAGVQIAACTGIYTYGYLPRYFDSRGIDEMAELFVSDIEKGIQGTDAKAAFLKCAADEPGLTPNVEKVHRAVARASVQTGAPVMAHSRPASGTGPGQVEIFTSEGVDPARIQIAHTGDTDDLDYIERLLDLGVFIGLDRFGLELFLPMDRRTATFAALLGRGHADRILVSQDFCATIDWLPPQAVETLVARGGIRDWSMTLVFDQVLPALREQGALAEADVDRIFIENPRRWLAG